MSSAVFIVGGDGITLVTDRSGKTSATFGFPVTDFTVLSAALSPSLVADADVFFTPAIASGAVTLALSLIVDADVFFAPTITKGAVTLVPNLITDADTFYVPTVALSAAPQTLTPNLYTDPDTFYAPSIALGTAPQTLTPNLYTDADTFYTPILIQPISLLPGLVTDADVFRAPNLGIDNRFIDPDIFYPFVTTTHLFPIWYRETDLHPTPVVVSRWNIFPPAFNADDAFYTPIVGVRTLLPPFLNADAVIAPASVSRYNPVLPLLISAAEAIFAPTVLRGSLTLRPSRVIDPDIFLSPIIGIVQVSDNPPGGDPSNLPGNLKYVSRYAMTQSGLILSMDLQSSSTKTVNTRMVIYRETAGAPVALAGVTTDKTSVVTGVNHYTLVAPVSVLTGDNIWMGLHSDGNFQWFLSNAPGGSKWNTDTWVGGATDPFGPTNNDNKKAPIVIYYLQSSNAAITVDKVIDLDVFYSSTILQISMLRPPLVTEEFFYTPIVRSLWTLAPGLYSDTDTFYTPTCTGKATVLPLRVVADDVVYSPDIAKFSPTIFSAPIPNDDVIYQPVVTQSDQRLFPQRVVDTDVFYSPQRSSNNAVSPPLVTALDVIFAPVVSKGAMTLAPPLLDSGIDFYLPEVTVVGGAHLIKPSLVIDTDVFYSPRKSGNAGWRRQVFILGDEADEISIIGEIPTPELVE